ncbi:type IV secretion system protein VirD4 [Anaerobium acetethylicum]|uniref:Type IV secretion system protein VirD4 n=1 Tax=Anaerobium acetethylicum TaxID=1619234 RepID=A0A1D3TUJ8_9FIRM|nr:type IV secretory system conjugative DNA transfer family protein [Anaerobium acetethylicum]SCP97752.1 type IV secretion system protein VirD4 [Anaerobium acetethylicum]
MIQKKKASPFFVLMGAVLSGYLGYLANGAWKEGMDINAFLKACNDVCGRPFADYRDVGTGKAVAAALGIYAVAIVMYLTSQRNLMPGREYGTAAFADVKQVNKRLADKDANFNRILSRNVRMSLDTRNTKLNNNVLIIGGSGAGKTFYEVKPNLMQMPRGCSFICTDPKGGAERSAMKSSGTVLLNY